MIKQRDTTSSLNANYLINNAFNAIETSDNSVKNIKHKTLIFILIVKKYVMYNAHFKLDF